MKYISLFVCFFIGLQTLNVPDYERLISNIESKVEIVDESKASFLSLKCRDVTNAIQIEKADLICRIEIQSQKKDKLESKYIQKKNYYELKKLEYGLDLNAIQKQDCMIQSYWIDKDLTKCFNEYKCSQNQYLKSRKQWKKNKHKLDLCESYLTRLDNCQKRLFERFSSLSQFNDLGEFDQDAMIAGNDALPAYGGYEILENKGMSCLVDGNYAIDTYSSFWQNPVENGTISARCWSYPDGSLHLGLDIASSMYSDVYALANGIVLYAHAPVESNNGYLGNMCGWPSGAGNSICMVVAVHDKLYAVSYAHLSNEIYVTSGQQVSQKTVIAKSGNSGNSTGPHTHMVVFELKQDLNSTVEYFRNSGADFSFGCGFNAAATCSDYACRIDPEIVLEGL